MVIKQEKYSYVFSRYKEPVAYVDSNIEITIFTEDAYSGEIKKSDDYASITRTKPSNPQTGPIYINGTEPGDTLVVDIIDIEPVGDTGASCLTNNFGGLVGTNLTRMINDPLPEKTWIYKIDANGSLQCPDNKNLCFPWAPFLGTIATSPEMEVFSTLKPFDQGGNMDVRDVKPGNRIYLPVKVKGAYFYTGDCHGTQGDGELCGSAIEIAAKIRIKFGIIKNKTISWPRIESKDELMVVGSTRPMEDAARIAYAELLEWMCELGWDKMEAYQALTQAGRMYVGNMVDPNYSLVAKIPKVIAYI